MNELILLATQIRNQIEKAHDELHGTCIKASEMMVKHLQDKGIEAKTVEGWCVYDYFENCSNAPYDAHTWVEAIVDGEIIFIDVTATQFQFQIEEEIPKVIVGTKPRYLQLHEPDEEQLEEMGW